MVDAARDETTFEASLKRLGHAVDQLEQGNLPLSEALRLFEEGLKASNLCRERLEEARQKVEVLVREAGGEFALSELDEVTEMDESSESEQDEAPF